jgi:spermidine synthase
VSLLQKVDLPEQSKGKFVIERFVVDAVDWKARLSGREVPIGETFTRLMRGRTVVMSDTPAEMRDHRMAVYRARASCLINGLGIGMVLKAVLAKPEVTDVTVVELEQDVLDMVAPHYADSRVTFVCADAVSYQPPKGKRYGMVWHDIWDNICSDNLPAMKSLHRKYGRRADWQGSWCRYECERADGRH